jgi:hypothetical protein
MMMLLVSSRLLFVVCFQFSTFRIIDVIVDDFYGFDLIARAHKLSSATLLKKTKIGPLPRIFI